MLPSVEEVRRLAQLAIADRPRKAATYFIDNRVVQVIKMKIELGSKDCLVTAKLTGCMRIEDYQLSEFIDLVVKHIQDKGFYCSVTETYPKKVVFKIQWSEV
jgi:hypothetical protein